MQENFAHRRVIRVNSNANFPCYESEIIIKRGKKQTKTKDEPTLIYYTAVIRVFVLLMKR